MALTEALPAETLTPAAVATEDTATAAGPLVGAKLPADLAAGLKRRQIPALDGIRAIAAYLVVFYHFHLPWVPGGLGVLAFFVLSGFLITWLLLKENDRNGRISLAAFYARRAFRIFPAFYVYAASLLVLLLIFHKRIVWGQAFASLFYLNNYYQAIYGDPNTGLSHTWSLAIEEQFYLLWPVTFLAFSGTPRRLAKVLLAAIVFVWIHRWVLIASGVSQGYIYEAFDTRADQLLVGCLLAVVLRYCWYPQVWQSLCSNARLPALTFAGLAVSAFLGNSLPGYRDAVGFVVDPLLVAVLIAQLIAVANRPAWRWIDRPAVRYLGRISYSVYLYQQIVPSLVEGTLGREPFVVQLLAHVVLVTILASASYFIVERPFLVLKENLTPSARAAGSPAIARPPAVPA